MSGKVKLKLRNYPFKLSQSIPDYNSISEDCLQCTKINYQTQLILKKNHSFILNNMTQPNGNKCKETDNRSPNTSMVYEQGLNLILSHSKPKKKLPIVPRYPSIPKPLPLNQLQKSQFPVKSPLPFNNQMIKKAFQRPRPIKRRNINITTMPNVTTKINLSTVLTKDPSLKCLYTNKMNKRLIQFFQLIYRKPSEVNLKQFSGQL